MSHIKKYCFLILLLIVTTSSYAKNKDWTDVGSCEILSRKLAQSSFNPIFNENIMVTFQARKLAACTSPLGNTKRRCTPSCFVDIKLGEQFGGQFLGSISLYHQENAHDVFIDNQKNFRSAININPFPWIVEGFYYFKRGNPYQEYNAYTNTGDYVVISFNYSVLQNNHFSNELPSETEIDNRFRTFLGIIGASLSN